METNKKTYAVPNIIKVYLDNEISLSLESTPPVGPSELSNNTPDCLQNNPFNTKLV